MYYHSASDCLKQTYKYLCFVSSFQVMFVCNHCPFVKHLKKDIAKLSSFYMEKGLAAVAISSNSIVTHPQVELQPK
uniref:Glutaredoxin-dependent peroxiredoxin n=1 Tax=Oryza brachyantha TaxID=4533 RepID=J3LBB5_ORYBR